MIIKLLIDGGEMKPGPAVAQQIGPMGINMGKVISDINDSTKEFKGMKVPIELDINEKSKSFEVIVFSPPTSELIKKELKLEKGTEDHKVTMVGNASIEDIIKITKTKHPNMLDKNLKSAVKSVLGTCRSIGILVDNKNPLDVVKEVTEGKFDKEIDSESIETSADKRKELNEFYNKIKDEQDDKLKLAKIAAEEEEAKKTEEAKAEIQDKGPATAAKIPAEDTKDVENDDKKK